jgi:hypothetical protein
MLSAYIRTLVPESQALANESAAIADVWTGFYGDVEQFKPYRDDFGAVFKALMDTKFASLKGKTMRDLVPYTAADQVRIGQAATYLRTGQSAPAPQSIAPRHVVSAARIAAATAVELAIEASAGTGDGRALLPSVLANINKLLIGLVKDQAPPGLRGSSSAAHKQFVAELAELI